jgi:hypothetical protein
MGAPFKHGMGRTKEYQAWANMRRRCYDQTMDSFKFYGARGIVVCDRWQRSFLNFYSDMGPAPSPAHSLDRKDSDGPYAPGNCQLATEDEQQNNKRSNRYLELDGVRMNWAQWSKATGLDYQLIRRRVGLGWSAREVLLRPVGSGRHA